jgi:glycosyltransferase involved in cell wall biosynthesis
MTFGLILLTFNEIDGITKLWEEIPFDNFDECFAVDGGSKDGTLEFFNKKSFPVSDQSKKGRGEAFRIAFKNSNSDVLIFYSPDGNENPKDIIRLRNQFIENNNLDLVIYSRMMEGAFNEEDDQIFKFRKWANNIFTFSANLIFNKNYSSNYVTDSINGFRGFKRSSFNLLQLDAEGYTIEYQSTIRAFKNKMMIKEIPTIEGQRIGGESYAKSIPTGFRFIHCLLKEIIR